MFLLLWSNPHCTVKFHWLDADASKRLTSIVHYDKKAETARDIANAEIQPLHRQIAIGEAGCIKKPAWTCLSPEILAC